MLDARPTLGATSSDALADTDFARVVDFRKRASNHILTIVLG